MRVRRCVNGNVGDAGCLSADSTESAACNVNVPCPGWSGWSAYSRCSVSCGGGITVRTRNCNNGVGGIDCPGDNTKVRLLFEYAKW